MSKKENQDNIKKLCRVDAQGRIVGIENVAGARPNPMDTIIAFAPLIKEAFPDATEFIFHNQIFPLNTGELNELKKKFLREIEEEKKNDILAKIEQDFHLDENKVITNISEALDIQEMIPFIDFLINYHYHLHNKFPYIKGVLAPNGTILKLNTDQLVETRERIAEENSRKKKEKEALEDEQRIEEKISKLLMREDGFISGFERIKEYKNIDNIHNDHEVSSILKIRFPDAKGIIFRKVKYDMRLNEIK